MHQAHREHFTRSCEWFSKKIPGLENTFLSRQTLEEVKKLYRDILQALESDIPTRDAERLFSREKNLIQTVANELYETMGTGRPKFTTTFN